jgi:hypothetical protein
LNIVSASAIAYGTGVLKFSSSSINPNAFFIGVFIDLFEGDEALKITGELHTGTPQKGAESCLGEGDSFTSGMLVYTDNGAGTQVDVSAEAASPSGSTFTFPGVGAGNIIYVGCDLQDVSDYYQFLGLKVLTDTAAVIGAGEIVMEFWNGSSWESFNWMSTGADSPQYTHAKDQFTYTIPQQFRFNIDVQYGWVKNNPITALSTNRFWVRIRIATAVTTAPVFQQFKLHSNRREINADGFPEYYGKGRPIGRLPWAITDLGKNASMGDQNVYLGDNVFGIFENNVWNSNGDQAPFVTNLPTDLDTSSVINLKWVVRPTSTGACSWTIHWAYSNDGDTLHTSAPGSDPANTQTVVINDNTTAGQQKTFTAELDVSGMRARIENGQPDILWVTIERTTGTGSYAGVALNPEYIKWCDGAHAVE